jgi:hypothetical protein
MLDLSPDMTTGGYCALMVRVPINHPHHPPIFDSPLGDRNRGEWPRLITKEVPTVSVVVPRLIAVPRRFTVKSLVTNLDGGLDPQLRLTVCDGAWSYRNH